VRLPCNYNTAQLKRTLQKGIEELERLWDLKQRSPEERFRKDGLGKWIAIFERKAKRSRTTVESIISSVAITGPVAYVLNIGSSPQELERQLIKRGIGPASAEELSLSQPATRIREMLELYDWYNSRGQPRGPGFLVQALRKPDTIAFPPGFESSIKRQQRQQAKEAQKQAQQRASTKRERRAIQKQNSRQRGFMALWEAMSPSDQDAFETEALEAAAPMKKHLYLQSSSKGGKAFKVYRRMILLDQFEHVHGLALPSTLSAANR